MSFHMSKESQISRGVTVHKSYSLVHFLKHFNQEK